jgi:uncharacterized protein involved in cysteine biosynthesis
MIALIRLVVFGFLALSVVYVLVSLYSQSVRREKLEKKFDAGGISGDRDAYIKAGMTAYQKGLRRKLIWLVYIIPMAVVAITVYFVNYQ